jgi:uncharacterized protein YdaU (DUF1376 family)
VANHPPAFQFYAGNFYSGTAEMTTTEVGGYILLLCRQWEHGSVPGDNLKKLAQIMRCSASTTKSIWATLAAKFPKCEDGEYRNARLEKSRASQLAYRSEQANRGRASAAAKANRKSTLVEPSPPATTQPEDNSLVLDLQSSEDQIKEQSDLRTTRTREDDDFDQFWACYPKKTGKDAALRAWQKARNKPDLALILEAVRQQRTSMQWLKDGGQFIPNPATWINQGRWGDEPVDMPQVSEKNARSLGAIYGD